MKRVLCVSVLLLLGCISLSAAGLRLIDLSRIDQSGSLGVDLRFLVAEENNLQSYIPDDIWRSGNSKEFYREKIKSVISRLDRNHSEVDSSECSLLMGLLYSYLYNLDEAGAYDKALDFLEVSDSSPGRDYRFKWFQGVHLAGAGKVYEAIDAFNFVASNVKEHNLHPDFWYDYGLAALYAQMPKRSVRYIRNFSEYASVSLDNIKLFHSIKNTFSITDPSGSLEKKDLFLYVLEQNGGGFLSYPFGIWVPVREDWSMKVLDYKNNFSAIVFKSDQIPSGLKTASYSLAVFFYVDKEVDLAGQLGRYEGYKKVDLKGLTSDFEVFEVWDSAQYVEVGGSRGLVAVHHSRGVLNNEFFEQPSKRPSSKEGDVYYAPLSLKIDRLSADISYMFLLDSCEMIFEQSRRDYVEFLNGLRFE